MMLDGSKRSMSISQAPTKIRKLVKCKSLLMRLSKNWTKMSIEDFPMSKWSFSPCGGTAHLTNSRHLFRSLLPMVNSNSSMLAGPCMMKHARTPMICKTTWCTAMSGSTIPWVCDLVSDGQSIHLVILLAKHVCSLTMVLMPGSTLVLTTRTRSSVSLTRVWTIFGDPWTNLWVKLIKFLLVQCVTITVGSLDSGVTRNLMEMIVFNLTQRYQLSMLITILRLCMIISRNTQPTTKVSTFWFPWAAISHLAMHEWIFSRMIIW